VLAASAAGRVTTNGGMYCPRMMGRIGQSSWRTAPVIAFFGIREIFSIKSKRLLFFTATMTQIRFLARLAADQPI